MKFTDFFAGLGGFHLAAKEIGGECVFACEIDDKLKVAYENNFGFMPYGDIKSLDVSKVPKHDLLCAGFPCQPFSKAGDQMGWKDKARGTVLYNIFDILKRRKPKYLILENVAHFIKHDNGNTYAKLENELRKLGYDVRHKKLSPHQFGIPQIRERMYLVGKRGKLNGFDWPKPTTISSELSIKDVLDVRPKDAKNLSKQVIDCLNVWQEFIQSFPKDEELPSFPVWSMEFKATYPYDKDSLFKYNLDILRKSRGSFGLNLKKKYRKEMLPRVPSHARAKENAFPDWKKIFIKQNREFYKKHRAWINKWLPKIKQFPPSLQKLEWNCKGEERDIWKYLIQFRASGVRVKRPTTSPSLVAMTTTQIPIVAWEKRYMTLKECARLQSMDKLEHFPAGGAGMAALGNAVNVKVVKLILEKLISQ